MDQQARKFVIGDNDATIKVIRLSVGERTLLESIRRNLYFLIKLRWNEIR